ncbi:MAG: nuclear transport factor 2 family protein [Gammaproteobacteria bacterium]|nr:nuclear transport factor 2 family protein [Gammaproteobacteria bacterium]
MSSAITTVRELIDGFNAIDMERITACFASDAVYHNIPMEAVQGVDSIRKVISQFMGSASEVQWDLLNIAEADAGTCSRRGWTSSRSTIVGSNCR